MFYCSLHRESFCFIAKSCRFPRIKVLSLRRPDQSPQKSLFPAHLFSDPSRVQPQPHLVNPIDADILFDGQPQPRFYNNAIATSIKYAFAQSLSIQLQQMFEKAKEIVARVYDIQRLKYKKKGLKNMLIAYYLLFCYFYYVPIFAKSIWPERIENKVLFQLTATTVNLFASTLIFSLLYIPGYLGVKAYKKYEIEPNLKKPWERDNWNYMKWRTLKISLFNQAVIFPLYVYVGLSLAGAGLQFQGFPTHWEIVKAIAIVMVADDLLYMLVHQIFHQIPALYRYHKIHHEYESVFCPIGQYCHPVQQLLANILPSTIIFAFFKVHIFIFIFWQTYKLYNSAEGHCGYEFPWSPTRVLPLIYGARYHDFHHSKNVGNYATSFYLFELLWGTNKVFFDRELAELKTQAKDQ